VRIPEFQRRLCLFEGQGVGASLCVPLVSLLTNRLPPSRFGSPPLGRPLPSPLPC
jgi:hypothetical protein